MDTQWKKALEILLSPTKLAMKVENIDPEVLDGTASVKPENESFESHQSSKGKKGRVYRENDYKKAQQLQKYIEMLLNKSPRDLETLEKFMKDLKDDHKDKSDHQQPKTNTKTHPPWK